MRYDRRALAVQIFFLVTLMLVHVSSKKMCLWRHSIYHLKAHRISNNMVLKLPAQRQEKSNGDKECGTTFFRVFRGFDL